MLQWSLALVWLGGASGFGKDVSLAWDTNPETDIATYHVYYGTASGAYTSTLDSAGQTSLTFSNLSAGTYYCVVTALDTEGLESLPSSELSFVVPVVAPTFLGLASGQSLNGPMPISLQITPSSAPFAKIEIWSGTQKLGEVSSTNPTLTWSNPPAGDYSLTVKAYDASGNVATSDPVTVHVVQPRLANLQWTVDNAMQLTIIGAPGRTQHIYVSADLQTWSLIQSAVNTSGTMIIEDSGAQPMAQAFYRIDSE